MTARTRMSCVDGPKPRLRPRGIRSMTGLVPVLALMLPVLASCAQPQTDAPKPAGTICAMYKAREEPPAMPAGKSRQFYLAGRHPRYFIAIEHPYFAFNQILDNELRRVDPHANVIVQLNPFDFKITVFNSHIYGAKRLDK